MANEQEVSPEQYKTRLLQQSFAERIVEYEDTIASLRTQVAMLQQQLESSENVDKEQL
jgi:hypothetical protein